MNLIFKNVTLKNFLSFGNVEQKIALNSNPYKVIMGLNKDKSDSADDANGCGKSSFITAIHYALFGKSIGNKVNLPSLVNNINKKNMVVKLEFDKDGVEYIIERGRNPNFLHLYKNGEEMVSDESQGDSRETQNEIERIIGLTPDIFTQIILLSGNVPIFMDQSTATQKEIIEKILGIDIISEKIAILKSKISETKNLMNNEQFKYDTLMTQMNTLKNTIIQQENMLEQNKKSYFDNLDSQKLSLSNEYIRLSEIDIEKEEKYFNLILEYNKELLENTSKLNEKTNLTNKIQNLVNDIETLEKKNQSLSSIDFDAEKEKFEYNAKIKDEQNAYNIKLMEHNMNVSKYSSKEKEYKNIMDKVAKLEKDLSELKPGLCPFCGNPTDEEHINKHKMDIMSNVSTLREDAHKCDLEMLELKHIIDSFTPMTYEMKKTIFNSINDLLLNENALTLNSELIESKKKEILLLNDSLSKIEIKELVKPTYELHYKNMNDIMNHKIQLVKIKENLDNIEKDYNTDIFTVQEKSIEELKKQVVEPSSEELDKVKDDLEHQEILLKLLNSPTSFVRKNILDKSLLFLNTKIADYLEKLGSLHSVIFNNDMSIKISYMGMDYNYVSSGELSRISLALNLAFRDVWETLNSCKTNLFMIDEVLDKSGLDTSGKEDIVKCLTSIKDRNIMVVSHDEVIKRSTNNYITIIKEQGFSRVDNT